MSSRRSLAPPWTVRAAVALAVFSLGVTPALAHGPQDRDTVPMVTVPAGPFLLGSPDGIGGADEHPQRSVYLPSFLIDRIEVTNERYLRFVKATGHHAPVNPYSTGRLSSVPGIEHLPVAQVTWHDASDYCRWAGKRLPTEAEWEKAARGGDGRMYPWGNEPPTSERANFERDWDGVRTLQPAGSFPAGRSPHGIDDMAGNAREWVEDWYHPDSYKNAADRNPRGPADGVLKVIRGGSWRHGANDVRAAMRGKGGFALKTDGTGFRCAKDDGGQARVTRGRQP